MNIPWRDRPKTLFDKIIDICMDAPAIVRKAYGFKYFPPSDHANLAISLVSDMAALIHRFDVFYYDFAKLYEGAQLFWEQEEPESGYVVEDRDGTSSILIFKPTLGFSDLDTASMLFMYCKCHHKSASAGRKFSVDFSQGHLKPVCGPASQTCRILPLNSVFWRPTTASSAAIWDKIPLSHPRLCKRDGQIWRTKYVEALRIALRPQR